MSLRSRDDRGNVLRVNGEDDVRGGIGSGEVKGSRKTKLGVSRVKVANRFLSVIKIR
jgi:hypothetical protein